MRILYLDCFSGISGDMTVGALADLGIKPSTFEWELSKIDLGDCHLHFERQTRAGIAGVKFHVHAGATHDHSRDTHSHSHSHDQADDGHDRYEAARSHIHGDNQQEDREDPLGHDEHDHHEHRDQPVRRFSDIRNLIEQSDLSNFVKQHATSIFRRIAEAEAKIHGAPIEDVQFHEVGALDSIVDVILACVGIESLKVERIHCSALIEGQGTFRFSHGDYPLPGPAALEILKNIPIRQVDLPFELITPTGAAIVAEFQQSIGPLPEIRPAKIGYGLGTRHLANRPNALRAVLGDLEDTHSEHRIFEVQTNIDDLSPEILGAAQERLFQAGALDVFFTPIQMKKGRPATMLSVLCEPATLPVIEEILFTETSTFGLRYRETYRRVLERELVEVETAAGRIQIKIGRRAGRILQVSHEFESCRAAAQRSGEPLKRVYELAIEAFWSSRSSPSENSSAPLEKVVELPL
jgi:pyridinium-3,5-bisthiocarboxylic acid mononucleotide nickel chelatase